MLWCNIPKDITNLHWLPLSARVHFKIIFLVYKAFLGLAPGYLCKLIMHPLSAISDRPLSSLVRNDLLVPRSRTSTSQQCAFASAGPLLWNCLPVKACAQILSSSFSSTLKSFFSWGLSYWRAPLISFYCEWPHL